MRHLTTLIIFLLITQSSYSQSFLDAYKKYKLDGADTISNPKAKKKMKRFIRGQILELDTVFQAYKIKTSFNFNSADTVYMIYDAPAHSTFTSDIIIWSDKDTISYRQGFKTIKPFKYKRIITYTPFIPQVDNSKGFKVVTERDSLISLVSKRDFNTIKHLGDNQNISDGSLVRVYVAYREKEQYKFESCFPNQFIIRDVYNKE